jgi:hypothetical protein
MTVRAFDDDIKFGCDDGEFQISLFSWFCQHQHGNSNVQRNRRNHTVDVQISLRTVSNAPPLPVQYCILLVYSGSIMHYDIVIASLSCLALTYRLWRMVDDVYENDEDGQRESSNKFSI